MKFEAGRRRKSWRFLWPENFSPNFENFVSPLRDSCPFFLTKFKPGGRKCPRNLRQKNPYLLFYMPSVPSSVFHDLLNFFETFLEKKYFVRKSRNLLDLLKKTILQKKLMNVRNPNYLEKNLFYCLSSTVYIW